MAFSFERDKDIDGVVLINPFHVSDVRGGFTKHYEKGIFNSNELDFDVYEEFVTESVRNVIRGLHFQTVNPQAKLVSVIVGEIYDVVVDLRLDSNTFCKWKGFKLTSESKSVLYVPKGFAHGFITLAEYNAVSYKCNEPYQQEFDDGIRWNDTDLNITWGYEASPIVSVKDENLQTLQEFKRIHGGF